GERSSPRRRGVSMQLSTLESSFQRQRYLGAAERRRLAGRMGLSEVQIKTWFQNRRMKLKRQLQELRMEPFCSPPLPYGPQSSVVPVPLTYVARPPPLPQEGSASGVLSYSAWATLNSCGGVTSPRATRCWCVCQSKHYFVSSQPVLNLSRRFVH
uniref:Homeobox domain-containing protein n=1 Tax=Calidris pygmaea TaxID=425635 RepID=A0A8C3JR19_9CHAR